MTLNLNLAFRIKLRVSLLSPYTAYRAWKDGSRPFMVWREADYRFIWGLPVNMRGKYIDPMRGQKWKIKQLLA